MCVTSYPLTNALSLTSLGASCCQVILLQCLLLCIYIVHVCLCVYHVLSSPALLFKVTVKSLSRVLIVRPRLSAQVLLCFVCDWKRSQRETEKMTEINWMYRGEGILKEILTESDRDLGSHSFLSVKVTRAITRHIDERTLSEGMCSADWRSVVIFHGNTCLEVLLCVFFWSIWRIQGLSGVYCNNWSSFSWPTCKVNSLGSDRGRTQAASIDHAGVKMLIGETAITYWRPIIGQNCM